MSNNHIRSTHTPDEMWTEISQNLVLMLQCMQGAHFNKHTHTHREIANRACIPDMNFSHHGSCTDAQYHTKFMLRCTVFHLESGNKQNEGSLRCFTAPVKMHSKLRRRRRRPKLTANTRWQWSNKKWINMIMNLTRDEETTYCSVEMQFSEWESTYNTNPHEKVPEITTRPSKKCIKFWL